MNSKMKNLIEQLQEECEKNEIPLVLGAIDPEKDVASVVFSGTTAMQAIIVAMLNDSLREQMAHNDCCCAACMATKEMMFHE